MEALFERSGDAGPTSSRPAGPADGRDGFDFLAGRWTVAHRRLRRRLVGDTGWDEFAGLCESRPIVGGLANVDDYLIGLPAGAHRAAALRLSDPATRLWSIWWIDGRALRLEPPVRGRFEDGVGLFHGDDALDGRPIRVRFRWSDVTPRSARWEQAFSAGGGASWEINWVMRFERRA
jgi:hypothetical protein